MDEMEQKLGAILGNPDLMKQIMSMAQSLGQQPAQRRCSVSILWTEAWHVPSASTWSRT